MGTGDLLRVFLIAAGIVFLYLTIMSLAKRRMTEVFCLAWGLLSVLLVLAGILLQPSELNRFISVAGLVLALMTVSAVLCGAFFLSVRVSQLMRQTYELAIQVSLLNQENERIMGVLSELTGRAKVDL
ncbi:MAG: DUF2304 domain-containing protein [Lachnospiraceae bacterium]|nr:DUF2304 domain-containing protein [Lachnospiraceae bacterium]